MRTNRSRVAAAVAVVVIGVAGLSGCDAPPDIEPEFPWTGDDSLTITAPLRVEGTDSRHYSDSIIVTVSKSLADEGWMPMLSDGACNVLSAGAHTQFVGADGAQVTSFDQTTATHIIIAQAEDDLDCELEYAVPEPTQATFRATIKVGS